MKGGEQVKQTIRGLFGLNGEEQTAEPDHDAAEISNGKEPGVDDGLAPTKTCFSLRAIWDPTRGTFEDLMSTTRPAAKRAVNIGMTGVDGMLGAPAAARDLGSRIIHNESPPDAMVDDPVPGD